MDVGSWFFRNWEQPVRVIAVGVASYAVLVLFLRISGKRTLSKMNAFDFVITVALGSTVATILLSTTVTVVDGVVALGLLILMQYIVAYTAVRSGTIQRITRSEPQMVFYEGQFLDRSMKRERVTRSEVLQAVRSTGHMSVAAVAAVVLETDGTFAVIAKSGGEGSALRNVGRPGAGNEEGGGQKG